MDDLLPVDIWLNILSRLPITSLLRCRSVCKTWRGISLDPHLPELHLSRASHNHPAFILYSHSDSHLYLLESSNLHNPIALKFPLDSWLSRFTVAGSCNGLLCLVEVSSHSHSEDIFIFNPSTADFIQLPHTASAGHIFSFGFGFDATTQEYKVVRIKTHPYTQFLLPPLCSTITVYTLGDSEWRKVGSGDFEYCIDHSSPSVLLNGGLHWKCYERVDHHECLASVACFNLASEALRVIPFPDFVNELDLVDKVSLVALGGCLSFYRTTFNMFSWYRITIWVMKDYGVKDSWEKQFLIRESLVFKPSIKFAKPLCLNDDGQILFICGGKQLVAYDPQTKSYRELGFYNTLNPVMAVAHVGSLIPLTFGNEMVNQLGWTRASFTAQVKTKRESHWERRPGQNFHRMRNWYGSPRISTHFAALKKKTWITIFWLSFCKKRVEDLFLQQGIRSESRDS